MMALQRKRRFIQDVCGESGELVAVVGNRTGWSYEEVEFHLKKHLGRFDTIVSGGAEGVDTFAQRFAEKFGHVITIFYPNPFEPSPDRYKRRNERVVHVVKRVIAFQCKPERSGTQQTINHAFRKGKPVIIIMKNLANLPSGYNTIVRTECNVIQHTVAKSI